MHHDQHYSSLMSILDVTLTFTLRNDSKSKSNSSKILCGRIISWLWFWFGAVGQFQAEPYECVWCLLLRESCTKVPFFVFLFLPSS